MIKGDADKTSLHYQPSSHVLGDVHPLWDNGKLYLFYLMPGGGYEVALATSIDMLHFQSEELTHRGPKAMQNFYVLGVLKDRDGLYKSYYGGQFNDMKGSVSQDLLIWENLGEEYTVPSQPWSFSSLRDPYVFWNEDEQVYWCLMTGKLNGRPEGLNGSIALSVSPDLKEWVDQSPLYIPSKKMGEHEVPMMFKIEDTWYLIYSILDPLKGIVGKPSYLSAGNPRGPWKKHYSDSLDGGDLRAAQVFFKDGEIYLAGWIPYSPGNVWGGSLNLPRIVYQRDDKSLGTKFDPQMLQQITGPLLFPVTSNDKIEFRNHGWRYTNQTISYQGDQVGEAVLSGEYSRFSMIINLVPGSSDGTVVIGITSPLQEDVKIEIALDMSHNLLSINELGTEIYTTLPIHLEQDKEYALHVIVDDDIIEVNCNKAYTLVTKLSQDIERARLSLMANMEKVEFSEPTIHWLKGLKDIE